VRGPDPTDGNAKGDDASTQRVNLNISTDLPR